jgi:uncharacterized protein (DUF1778 family)
MECFSCNNTHKEKQMSSEDSPTTLSTRFDEQEMALLRQAAEKKQWSLSQLLRAGAYEKAVNIINAQSTAVYPVRRLLSEVLTQLIHPRLMLCDDGDDGDGFLEEFDPDRHQGAPAHLLSSTSLGQGVAAQLAEAIRRLGAELAPMLLDECTRLVADQDSVGELIDPAVAPARSTTDQVTELPMDKVAVEPSGKPAKKAAKPKKNRQEH